MDMGGNRRAADPAPAPVVPAGPVPVRRRMQVTRRVESIDDDGRAYCAEITLSAVDSPPVPGRIAVGDTFDVDLTLIPPPEPEEDAADAT